MEIIDQDTKTRCESPLRRVLETGRAVALPRGTILISNDGTQRHVAASAAPIVGEQGQVQGVVAVVRYYRRNAAAGNDRILKLP